MWAVLTATTTNYIVAKNDLLAGRDRDLKVINAENDELVQGLNRSLFLGLSEYLLLLFHLAVLFKAAISGPAVVSKFLVPYDRTYRSAQAPTGDCRKMILQEIV